MNDINRSVIIDYLSYLNKQRSSPGTRATRISDLAVFFFEGTINKWFNLSPYLIQRRLSSDTKSYRYIPEVMYQPNLDELPESVMRMVLVIQECGLRVELCQLPLNCLKQDAKGGWFIQFMRWKVKTETTIPTVELSKVIQEQNYIRQNLNENYEYLLPTHHPHKFIPKPEVMHFESFTENLKD